ncbi:DEAD-box ATP-dependent RNA helicase [Linnemannia hyalina]|uniref:DEAD-box ATP-dependent RNA helicase n=1 Tax=Linnemannia hyalina TaxID=64524 RepID=A0A9P7XWL7_9FUNG|nr:DEAD-box ATP-dependent RNA helicase [Linnemannia hyalina]
MEEPTATIKDYTDETAPDNAELEYELFDEESRTKSGIYVDKYNTMFVSVEGVLRTAADNTPLRYTSPVMISWPGPAQTGFGKTIAFLTPILSKLLFNLSKTPSQNQPGAGHAKVTPFASIIVPTRELGIQMSDSTRSLLYKSPLRLVVVYRGADMKSQKEQLAGGFDILIATPDRLIGAIERGLTALFSATFPPNVQVLVVKLEEYQKEEILINLLLSQLSSRTVICVNSKLRADKLDDVLSSQNFPCISLHGDRNQREREAALDAFKTGRSPIMIATSVASLGLDIKDVIRVVN